MYDEHYAEHVGEIRAVDNVLHGTSHDLWAATPNRSITSTTSRTRTPTGGYRWPRGYPIRSREAAAPATFSGPPGRAKDVTI